MAVAPLGPYKVRVTGSSPEVIGSAIWIAARNSSWMGPLLATTPDR